MSIGLSRFAFAMLLGLSAAGCAYNDHVDNRVARYDVASEKARDEMILTNVIRASRAEPLAFVQLGQVTGFNTSGTTVGLPSIILGPKLPDTAAVGTAGAFSHFAQGQTVFGADPGSTGFSSNSFNISGSTTFNVTPSESKDFYLGLLTTVQPDILAFFTQQGIAPELLFYLFTDKIIEEKHGVVTQYHNDPLDPNFQIFQEYVALAMQYGLTSEQEPGAKAAAAKKKTTDDSAKKTADSTKDDTTTPPWRLCFDKTLWPHGLPAAGNTPLCHSATKLADPRMVTFFDKKGELVKLQVLPRSTFAIFQFLGHVVAAQQKGLVKLQSPDAIGQPPLSDDSLFVVNEGGVGLGELGLQTGGCFLDVVYDGRNYCVPDDGARNTKRILGLLAQLIALSTSLSSISVTPQVQLIQ
jgi:hypothetical protein